jgi:hypothetical protein
VPTNINVWFDAQLEGVPRETAVEAAYYVVRELKQTLVARVSRKEHLVDADQSRPSQEGLALADRLRAAIAAREEHTLDDLSDEALRSYIDGLLAVIRRVNAATTSIDLGRGRQLLDRLRGA